MKTLIVVDAQNEFVTGKYGSSSARAAIPLIQQKIQEYNDGKNQIIFTRDTRPKKTRYEKPEDGHRTYIPLCEEGSDGWKIVDGLEVPNCSYVDKETLAWTRWSDTIHWNDLSRGRRPEIAIVGPRTDTAVLATALILRSIYPDATITVYADCCAGTTRNAHKEALNILQKCQVDVK